MTPSFDLYCEKCLPPLGKIEQVAQMDSNCLRPCWSMEQWRYLYENSLKSHWLVVLEKDQEIYGFALWLLSPLEHLAHLLKLVVMPRLRRQGMAKLLLEKSENQLLLQDYRQIYLEVNENNDAACGFYTQRGFKQINRVKKFYSQGQAALILSKNLRLNH